MTHRVLTVGHSTRESGELVEILRAYDVTELVDVRSFPASRKFPQWNKAAIIDNLPSDIGYRWLPNLGGRRHTPTGTPSVNTAWRVKAFRDYADYMQTPEFAKGLGELIELSRRHRPVIMCSEAVPWRCHRRLITDAVIVAGVEVTHIMSATASRPATLNDSARIADGTLIYPQTRAPA
ncbi:DNA repair protein [Mycobacterium sp. SWH-M5]|nr:DNA repair protein [Mycobacterium sp. SWH-M5]